jgi:hypothetical protein
MRHVFFTFCFLLLFPLLLWAQFAPYVDYPAGHVPFGVVVGDFNGDGKLDVAVTNNADNTVSILLGNGDGTFQPQVAYATGRSPAWLIAADFNKDGKLDLAVTNAGDNSVSILLGKGDGTFKPHVDYATGGNDQYLAAADFNNDGKLDLAVANYDSSNISVLLGNGDGTFQPQQTYPVGFTPFGVMAGDFNHDGNVDLAVTDNNGYWGVYILLGNGNGTFQQPVWFAVGTNPRVGVVADFNGDGNLDLAIGNCLDSDLSILFGDGHGNFSGPVNYGTGAYGQAVAAGDFNLDGKLDLVTANSGSSNSVSVLLGNGDGTFPTRADYATGNNPRDIAVGDFNGDGAPDLVTANYSGNTVSILLNTARATATTLSGSPNPAAPLQQVIYVAAVQSKSGQAVSGTVIFKDSGTTVATVTLVNQLAAWSTRYRTAGVHQMTATYSGDANNNGSTSSMLTEYVVGSSKTLVTTSGSPSFVGQPVTFNATVTSKYGTIPDGGTVAFYDGRALLGSVTLANQHATYTTAALSAGVHTVKGVYGGAQTFKPSSGAVRQVVNKYSTTTSLTSSPNPSSHGQPVTFTATVTPSGPYAPTGKVKFWDGTTGIGAATLVNGVATLTTSKLAVGTHAITALYPSDAYNDKSTSAVVNQVVQ